MTRLLFLTCFSLLILFITISQSDASESNNLIEKTCAKTDYKNLCSKSFQTDPKSSSATNQIELAEIMLNILSAKANATLTHAIKLARNTRDPGDHGRYTLCQYAFGEMAGRHVPQALDVLKSKEYGWASGNATLASDDAWLCYTQFITVYSPKPLIKEAKVVHDVAVVASNIIDHLP